MDNDNNIIRTDEATEQIYEPEIVKPPLKFGRLYGKMTWLFSSIAVMIIAVNIFAVIAIMAVRYYFPELEQTNWYETVLNSVAFYFVGVPIAAIMLLFSRPDTAVDFIRSKTKLTFGKWMKYLCMAFAFMYAGNWVGNIVTGVLGLIVGHSIENPVASALDGASWIISTISMVIIAPIFEELLFRKLLIDRMQPYGEKTAIIASALAFGLVHGNFSQFFYAFGVGLLFGYVYCKTKNIWYTISFHMIINGVCGILTGYISSKIDYEEYSSVLESIGKQLSNEEAMELVAKIGKYLIPMIALGVISLVVFGAAVTGIVFFAKGIKNISLEDCKYDISAKNVRIAAYANVGIIILYAIMAISFITSIIYY